MTKALAQQRFEEIKTAVYCENSQPLCLMQGNAAILQWADVPFADFCADPLSGFLRFPEFLQKLVDEAGVIHGFNSVGIIGRPDLFLMQIYPAKVLLPGREIQNDTIWQIRETELMREEDYGFLNEYGYDAFLRKIFPRFVDVEEYDALMAKVPADTAHFMSAIHEAGFAVCSDFDLPPQAPFEVLSGLRTFRRLLVDCYKDLPKVKAASEQIMAGQKQRALALIAEEKMPSFAGWIGGWRSSPSFLAPRLWEGLIWPYLKEAGDFMVSQGKVPIFHLDMCWDREIERFADFPAVIIHTDGSTDLVRARKLLGNHVCLMGDVPSTLLTYGKPADVREYVWRRLDDLGPKGFIVCPGCDSPYQTPYENIAAMVEAVQNWH